VGPDGNLWVTLDGSGALARVTPGGQISFYRIDTSGALGITVGPDGALWFTGDPIERRS
jgi:virginiamycin B lyase